MTETIVIIVLWPLAITELAWTMQGWRRSSLLIAARDLPLSKTDEIWLLTTSLMIHCKESTRVSSVRIPRGKVNCIPILCGSIPLFLLICQGGCFNGAELICTRISLEVHSTLEIRTDPMILLVLPAATLWESASESWPWGREGIPRLRLLIRRAHQGFRVTVEWWREYE